MAAELFTFDDFIARVAPGFNATGWKMVRHLENSKEAPDFAELVSTDRAALEFYQRFQNTDIFSRCEGFFSFVGLPEQRALFVGAYRLAGPTTHVALEPSDPSVPAAMRDLWGRWCSKTPAMSFHYALERDPRFEPLEGRAVIDWGQGAIQWHQWETGKPIVELREAGRIAPCPPFPDIDLSLQKIAFLAGHEASNPSWRTRLGSVGGIYLLTDHRNHRLYVGQAGAEGEGGGFWARWKQYAAGASGNVLVDAAFRDGTIRPGDPDVTMSVLEVVPLGKANKARLDALENRWKLRLRSRSAKHGLNDN